MTCFLAVRLWQCCRWMIGEMRSDLDFEDRRIKHGNCYISRSAIVDVVNRNPTHGMACVSSLRRSQKPVWNVLCTLEVVLHSTIQS